MEKNSKIYIAGHSGLLGSALLKRLKANGYGNLLYKRHGELELTDKKEVEGFFEGMRPEYVFLAAGLTGGIMANKTNPATFFHTNISIQDNVFEASLHNGVKAVVFYGSSCIYPKNSSQPIKEEYLFNGEIEQTSEAYAAAKISGIIACKSYNAQYGSTKFISLVPNSMYGPGDNFDLENSHVLSALLRKFHEAKIGNFDAVNLWGSGNPRREFIFSEDVAEASIFAMQNLDRFDNMHYNIGSGADYSINELAVIISEIVGFKGKIEWDTSKPDGARRKLLDSSRFLSLGFTPKVDIENGLKMTYEWFKGNCISS